MSWASVAHRPRYGTKPGDVVPFARSQAIAGKHTKSWGVRNYVPRDLSDDQLHEVERLLKVHGLKRKHIALMCSTSVRLINRYFPAGSCPDGEDG